VSRANKLASGKDRVLPDLLEACLCRLIGVPGPWKVSGRHQFPVIKQSASFKSLMDAVGLHGPIVPALVPSTWLGTGDGLFWRCINAGGGGAVGVGGAGRANTGTVPAGVGGAVGGEGAGRAKAGAGAVPAGGQGAVRGSDATRAMSGTAPVGGEGAVGGKGATRAKARTANPPPYAPPVLTPATRTKANQWTRSTDAPPSPLPAPAPAQAVNDADTAVAVAIAPPPPPSRTIAAVATAPPPPPSQIVAAVATAPQPTDTDTGTTVDTTIDGEVRSSNGGPGSGAGSRLTAIYESPLLAFRGYRAGSDELIQSDVSLFNASVRTRAGAGAGGRSATSAEVGVESTSTGIYALRIDPHRALCPFDLRGLCHDPKCPWLSRYYPQTHKP